MKFKKLRKSHRGTNFETKLKACLAIATSRPMLIPIGSSQRQKGGESDPANNYHVISNELDGDCGGREEKT